LYRESNSKMLRAEQSVHQSRDLDSTILKISCPDLQSISPKGGQLNHDHKAAGANPTIQPVRHVPGPNLSEQGPYPPSPFVDSKGLSRKSALRPNKTKHLQPTQKQKPLFSAKTVAEISAFSEKTKVANERLRGGFD